jgi:hypothetical protein
MSKKNNIKVFIIPDFKLFYRAISIKTARYLHKTRHLYQRNRIEDPDINPYRNAHLLFDKVAQNIQWRNDTLFNKCQENWISAYRKLKLDPSLSPCTNKILT